MKQHEVICLEQGFSGKLSSLLDYREALERKDRIVFDRLMSNARGHVMACGKASTSNLTILESLLLTIAIEQQKKIEMTLQTSPA